MFVIQAQHGNRQYLYMHVNSFFIPLGIMWLLQEDSKMIQNPKYLFSLIRKAYFRDFCIFLGYLTWLSNNMFIEWSSLLHSSLFLCKNLTPRCSLLISFNIELQIDNSTHDKIKIQEYLYICHYVLLGKFLFLFLHLV